MTPDQIPVELGVPLIIAAWLALGFLLMVSER